MDDILMCNCELDLVNIQVVPVSQNVCFQKYAA